MPRERNEPGSMLGLPLNSHRAYSERERPASLIGPCGNGLAPGAVSYRPGACNVLGVRGKKIAVANVRQPAIMCRCLSRHEPGVAFTMDEVRGSRSALADIAPETESLILVDEADREVGHLDKAQCHRGSGVLHRAFSLLIFNDLGELLLQQRAASKPLWPLYWSNSCCSHPRRAETMETAIHRRLYEELGLRCPLHFLFKFQYQAQFDAAGAEQELCSVFIGRASGPVRINPDEILAWRWISPQNLQAELASADAGRFTPWFVIEWERIWRDHRDALLSLQ
jgi:isopentenyl-diphosphate Delta-isomerase